MSRLIEAATEQLESLDIHSLDSVIYKAKETQRKVRSDFVYFYPPPQALQRDSAEHIFSEPLATQAFGLYVHLPFCITTCGYCHYVRKPKQRQKVVQAYVDAIKKEWELWHTHFKQTPELHSLHFGGGTPTYLRAGQLQELLTYFDGIFGLEGIEVTCETHPRTASENKLDTLAANGVNRINLGIQTFDDKILKLINRYSTKKQVLDTIQRIRKRPFHTLNVDLMYGLPDQTLGSWERDLEIVCDLMPESVSLYPTRIKPMAEISKLPESRFPTATELWTMHLMAMHALSEAGYTQFMPHQFGLGEENRYQHQTLLRAENKEYLALGVAGYSFLDRFGFFKGLDRNRYVAGVNGGRILLDRGRKLNDDEMVRRAVVLGFFYSPAVKRKLVEEQFGVNLEDFFSDTLPKLQEAGLVSVDEEAIALTLKGKVFANEVSVEFYSEEDKQRLRQKEMTYGAFLVDEK